MRTLSLLALFALPVFALAYTVVETIVTEPYEIIPVENDVAVATTYLGTLADYPVMYEFVVEEKAEFSAQLAQPKGVPAEELGLLLIRRNDQGAGVKEIARQKTVREEWVQTRDSLLGLTLEQAEPLDVQLEPGTYRLEVSSPRNMTQYMLTIGQEPDEVGYGAELSYVRQTQAYFGYSVITMLRSSLVYYPIGIIILLAAFYQTARFARRRRDTQPQPDTHA